MFFQPIRYLKGIGPKKEKIFNKLGIYTIYDLLYYFPFRYEDRRNFKKINELKENEFAVVVGKVLARNLRKIPAFVKKSKVRSIFEAILSDETGYIKCIWFNQPYLVDYIKLSTELIIYGKPKFVSGKFEFICPAYELLDDRDSLNLGRIVGIYRTSGNINQKFIRKLISFCLEKYKTNLADPIPFNIRKEKKFFNIATSLSEIHFPSSFENAKLARERFIFQELFFSQILVYLRKAKHYFQEAPKFFIKDEIVNRIKENLNFSLTSSQNKALSDILNDFKKPYPMHRLLQGDVGCGKTVVAAFGIAICASSGYQAALMVPTEILAYQHKDTLEKIFKGLNFNIEILVSSLGKKKIELIKKRLLEGDIDIVVGTHALIQEDIKFKKLGFVVIDEEHRFGVAQRALLPQKGKNPHFLIMSATPIPRSLALSLYGDFDLSVIEELPIGRLLPKTIKVKEEKRSWVYDFLIEKIKEGRQAYIIYPVIEETEDEDLRSLQEMYEKLKEKFFNFSVEMFHGKLPLYKKLEIINNFREKKIDILLSTTVIEVGVNVENANVMVVENPERFGLAQLHQLRGRIQRWIHQPYFLLIESKDNYSEDAEKRLNIIANINDGFKIAEEDLKLRGPGDFFGDRQHGYPQLRIANPIKDLDILKEARLFAYRVIKTDPQLKNPSNRCIREYLDVYFKNICIS